MMGERSTMGRWHWSLLGVGGWGGLLPLRERCHGQGLSEMERCLPWSQFLEARFFLKKKRVFVQLQPLELTGHALADANQLTM
jgi:hypothetical protein